MTDIDVSRGGPFWTRRPPGNDQDIDEKRTGSRVLVDGCTSGQMLRVKHATGIGELTICYIAILHGAET